MLRRLTFYITAALCLWSCSAKTGDFSKEETSLIRSAAFDGIMRVLTIEDPADHGILRKPSADLSDETLKTKEYKLLCSLMVATVTHPSQDGVGIAGPQVGLNRRVVAVQRFDKEGEPFEVYPNIRIVWASESMASGPEGCLSVPDRREDVMRSTEIVIEYTDMDKEGKCQVQKDTVKGFTAVIFQHEIDHLDGILYIDRL